MLVLRCFGLFGERGDEVRFVLTRLVGKTFVVIEFSVDVALGTDEMQYKSVVVLKK